MTITKTERSARKKKCGTENPDRARSWILVINALEEQTWGSPVEVINRDDGDLKRILGKGNALCARDFMRCFPHRNGLDGRKYSDLGAIRALLADAFDLRVA